MTYIIKKFTLFLMILTSNFIFSQNITIRGKVLDKNTKTPLEFVTIAVYDKLTQKALGGTTSLKDGTFRLTTNAKSFYIEVSFIGFKTKKITDFKNKNNQVNLKTVILEEKAQTLDEVVIQTEKSTTEFRLDKRVFNVGKDLSSVGANALEVLNNVPSVTVNIEGQISLRGSTGVQMLINGKPSVLASEESNALGTITADMIERIEVITNPSAKYDAEGTTGIINIVLKKNKKRGLNGSITLNTGIPNNHSLGLSLNKRTERFNLFSQLGAGYRTYPNKSEGSNRNIIRGSEVNSKGEGSKNESFYNIILGTDYHINSLNVLTLSGNFAYEKEREDADTKYNELQNNALINKWNRSEKTKGTNPKWEYELQYKKQFKSHKDHGLLISATGNFFGKNNKSDFESKALLGTKTNNPERSETKFNEARYTYKLDYTKPFLEKYTLELGSQYNITDVNSNYKVSNLTGGIWLNDANLTNTFNYNQGVFATYGTLGYEGEKWGLKAGLRVENTNLKPN